MEITERTQIERTPFEILSGGNTSSVKTMDEISREQDAIDRQQQQQGDQEDDTTNPKVDVSEPTPSDNEDSGREPDEQEGGDEVLDDHLDDVQYEVKGNVAKYFADVLKAKGNLPEDFEITDDITEEQINTAYIKYKEEPYLNQLREEVRQEFMEKEGLTEDLIKEVKAKHYGVQDAQIQELNLLSEFSKYQFDENSETFEEDAKALFNVYYQMKGFKGDKLNRFVSDEFENEDQLKASIAEVQKELGAHASGINQEIQNQIKTVEEQRISSRLQRQNRERELLKSKKIGDLDLTDQQVDIVQRGLDEKTEIVEVNGKRYRTSKYNALMLKAKEDPEINMKLKALILLNGDISHLKDAERSKAVRKVMSGLNDYIDVKSKNRSGGSEDGRTKGGIERTPIG